MEAFPFGYERIAGTTWAYLSSLLMLALFFKFNRFWSVRNLDLFLIIMLAPGLLMVDSGRRWVANQRMQETIEASISAESVKSAAVQNGSEDSNVVAKLSTDQADELNLTDEFEETREGLNGEALKTDTQGHAWQRWGYYWLFGIGAVFLIRMLVDPSMTRRPLLDSNLAIGGLVFFACSLMMFLFANIVTSAPTNEDLSGARNAVKLLQRKAAEESDTEELKRRGPGYALFNLFPIIPSFESGDAILKTDADKRTNMSRYILAAKSLAIISQILIVLGMVLFCHYNYNNFKVGVGTATIYLMLPYTAVFTGHVLHVLPAALILWAIVCFRRPLLSGLLVGLATGVSYYPIFLLPLWASFYWKRGVGSFIIGWLIAIAVCIGGLAFTSVDSVDFFRQLQAMFGFWSPLMDGLQGIWALGWNQWWRLPLLVSFVLLCVSFVAWPAEKNIGTLVSYSAAIMIAIQFWHGFYGGLYMAWYLPMVLLIFFRPNLNGRVATIELGEPKRKHKETAEDLLPAA